MIYTKNDINKLCENESFATALKDYLKENTSLDLNIEEVATRYSTDMYITATTKFLEEPINTKTEFKMISDLNNPSHPAYYDNY